MSILVNRSTKIITQGMTGETGTFHTQQAHDYRTLSVEAVKELLVACKAIDSSLG